MEKTLGSLFDGIGGFPLAGSYSGFTSLWASEIDPFPIRVTKTRFPGMQHLGNITKINGAEIEPVSVIAGGSPCQDLSVAGKRAGMAQKCNQCGKEFDIKDEITHCPICGAEIEKTRSGLFMEQIRIVKEMREADAKRGRTGQLIRPRFMVWENVPGAFSSHNGEDFRIVLEETCRIVDGSVHISRPSEGWSTVGAIVEKGFSLAWRVLDAQYWGVPQRRRRIFLVADFAGFSAPKILFKCESVPGNPAQGTASGQRTADNAERGVGASGFNGWRSVKGSIEFQEERAPCMNANMGPNVVTVVPINDKATRYNGGGYTRNEDGSGNGLGIGKPGDPAPTLSCGDRHMVAVSDFNPKISPTVTSKWSKGTGGPAGNECQNLICCPKQLNKLWDIAPTLSARYYQNQGTSLQDIRMGCKNLIPQDYAVRRLTPLECERLQGFPDGWTNIPGASDSARYKALGNSVAVPCVAYIFRGIAKVLEEMGEAD